MPRIRSIKPDFPQSESMGRVSRDARLCFVMLWTLADDSGRLRGNSRMLASLLFPYDEDAPKCIDGWLDELSRERCVRRYEADGGNYIEILNWLNHQKIDKPSPSKIPPFDESSRTFDESSRILPVGEERKGEEGKGRERKAESAQAPKRAPRKQALPEGFGISERVRQWAEKQGHTRLDERLEHFVSKAKAKGYTYADWDEAFMNAIRDDWGDFSESAGKANGKTKGAAPWWSSDPGIEAKARELGMTPRAGESWQTLKGRINAKLEQRP